MRVHQQLSSLPSFIKPVLTIGTFDGVHYGHRKILTQLCNHAREIGGESIVISFEPHPRLITNPGDTSLRVLSSLQEKILLLSALGIDHFVVVPFTKQFSEQLPADYISNFLVRHFDPHTIIIGFDHHFGYQREGNIELLRSEQKKYNYDIVEIPQQLIKEIEVSSTKIRKHLLAGNIAQANTLLVDAYSIQGNVVHGQAMGRTIGYPTANIAVHNKYKLIPANGVYAIQASFQGVAYGGMMNIGTRPTITGSGAVSIEAHLFDFSLDIYDQQITVTLIEKLRDEKKFDGVAQLIAAIQDDEIAARKILQQLR